MMSRAQLESVAADVIQILKNIKEISHARVAVIGGLAVWKYNPRWRTTQDVDFIINIDGAPQVVKQKLLALPNSPFDQRAQIFVYKAPFGMDIQVDITPEWQSPYMPAAATRLKDIPPGTVPYISAVDLIVFKINSCGLRAELSKKTVDAMDVKALLEMEPRLPPVNLTSVQQAIVEPCISDIVIYGRVDEAWLRGTLGLPARQ